MNNSTYFRDLIVRLEREDADKKEKQRKALEEDLQAWRSTVGRQIEQGYKNNVRVIRLESDTPQTIVEEMNQQGFKCEPKYMESQMTNSDVLSYYQVTFPQQK